jgi:hypothetical protein
MTGAAGGSDDGGVGSWLRQNLAGIVVAALSVAAATVSGFFSYQAGLATGRINQDIKQVETNSNERTKQLETMTNERMKRLETDTQIQVAQKQFDSQKEERRARVIVEQVPRLFSEKSQDVQAAKTALFVLYPNDSQSIFAYIAQSLSAGALSTPEVQEAVTTAVAQAERLNMVVGDWAVVISSDADLAGAQDEVNRAQQANYSGTTVYKRQDWYATAIGGFPSQSDADRASISIRTKIRDSAFVVNLSAWCPRPMDRGTYQECS